MWRKERWIGTKNEKNDRAGNKKKDEKSEKNKKKIEKWGNKCEGKKDE